MSQAAFRFPPQVKFIVWTEACERFSYYGMRSILVIYMTKVLLFTESEAKGLYHLFVGSSYFLALAGAFLADRLVGKYRTILWLSIVYCLGHGALALGESRGNLYLGLALIAIGASGIKPCVSAMVGDQFTAANQKQLEKVFELFYFAINIGVVTSMFLIPWVLPRYGANVAFAIPGVLMVLSLAFFFLGRKQYVKVPPAKDSREAGFLAVLWEAWRQRNARPPGTPYLEGAAGRYGREGVQAARSVLGVCSIFAWIIAFWSLYDQSGASWVLQADKLDLRFLGITWEASQVQGSNGFFVLALIPLFSFGLYPLVEKMGVRVTPLRKMSAGLVLIAVSFVLVWGIQVALEGGRTVNIGWQFLAYLILSASEVMVSITGLEFAYTQSPRSMKSTIMSLWLLTIALGNYFTAFISVINRWQGSQEFLFYIAVILVVTTGFIATARRYKEHLYVEGASA